ncbi:exosome complex protein Rrp42 [Candidatus Woesearchaeota archaeon]|nr:exosome complex protein Rrp42 [Candidatus Woesearchaeota archaeon]
MRTRTVKSHISALLSKNKREDNRKFDEFRNISIDVNPIPRAHGSCKVKLGETEVIVGVKLDVGEPFPDTPNEGVLIVNAELGPLASPEFESGPPRENAIELARVIDRGIRESKCIDFEKLCIKEKEKVWMLFIDVYPINDSGNLLDASALAAIIALKNALLPKYDKKEEKVLYKEFTKKKLPLTKTPIQCTYAKINGSIILDPSKREEDSLDSRLSISILESGNICAMQKGEVGTFTDKEILDLVEKAIKKSKDLRKLVK